MGHAKMKKKKTKKESEQCHFFFKMGSLLSSLRTHTMHHSPFYPLCMPFFLLLLSTHTTTVFMRSLGRRVFLRQVAASYLPLQVQWRAVSFSGCGGGNPPSTYYDYLDRFCNRQWFGATETLLPLSDLSPFSELFVGFQDALGLDPAVAILLFGMLTRFSTLYFSLYGERASERMRNAMHRLKVPQEAFQRVYYREGSAALDIQLAATALRGERRRVFSEEKTSNAQCLASLMGTPIVLFGLFQTKTLCESPQLDFGTSSFLWCTALTMPDPYGILPLVFCGLMLTNFELSISKELRTGWMSNIIWGARLGCLCALPVVTQIRAGVALYFLGMSLVGLLQPLLLRTSGFRRWFDFPSHKLQLKHSVPAETNDDLHARMSVQFPYLTSLLNPEPEENTSFLKNDVASRATSSNHLRSRSSIPFSTEGSTRGTNSIMREELLRPTDNSSFSTTPPVLSRRGVDFVTTGWKTTRVEFREEDFIPGVGGRDVASSKGNSVYKGKK